ncbi:hypothetical protein PSEUDO8AS_50104 [Pseudomonas sp. 8AS]|nr:hypothetical protein PSEUDO8AS_50104 [Pseudomonas sp. 8AS]
MVGRVAWQADSLQDFSHEMKSAWQLKLSDRHAAFLQS